MLDQATPDLPPKDYIENIKEASPLILHIPNPLFKGALG